MKRDDSDMNLKIQPNRRLCFFGDSITAHGLWIRDIAEWLLERHTDKRILPLNCGVPGDSADNALNRIYVDCGGYFPEQAVVLFGMNDIGRELYRGDDHSAENTARREQRLELYRTSIERIGDILTELGAAVTLCTPTPYDAWRESTEENLTECNEGLARCGEIVRELAERRGWLLVDFYGQLLPILAAGDDPALIGDDRVHPSEHGHHVMAWIFLRTLGLADDGWSPPAEFHTENLRRFETEQILRKLSFVDWCLNHDVTDEWEPAHRRIIEKLEETSAWHNAYVDETAAEYRRHKNNQDRLRNELIRQTVGMYRCEGEERL